MPTAGPCGCSANYWARQPQWLLCVAQARIGYGRASAVSRPGNPYDNALAESGWSTLKTELLPRGACFADLVEARLKLAEYLDYYYNTQRLHSALGYYTPLEVSSTIFSIYLGSVSISSRPPQLRA